MFLVLKKKTLQTVLLRHQKISQVICKLLQDQHYSNSFTIQVQKRTMNFIDHIFSIDLQLSKSLSIIIQFKKIITKLETNHTFKAYKVILNYKNLVVSRAIINIRLAYLL